MLHDDIKKADELAYQAKIKAYHAAQQHQARHVDPFKLMPFQHIATFLPLSDVKRFAYSCRAVFFSKSMQPVIKRASDAVHQFLVHVRNADLLAVSTMLETDPGLLLEKQIFGEHGKVTGLQLAKRMGDIGMCQLMLNCLQALDAQHGFQHTNAQIKNVLTNSQMKASFDVSNYDNAADAIARHRWDAATELTRHRLRDQQRTNLSDDMDAYRRACDEHGEFTAQDLINVSDALVRNADKFITYHEFDLYFLQVMGYVARKLPMFLKLALDLGIVEMIQDNFELYRHTRSDNHHSPYSFADIPNARLGFDFSFNFTDNRLGGICIAAPRDWFYLSFPFRTVCLKDMGRPFIEEFNRALQEKLIELMMPQPEAPQLHSKRKKHRCR